MHNRLVTFAAIAIAFVTIAPLAARAQSVEIFQKQQAQVKRQEDMQLQRFAPVDKAHPSLPASDILALRVEHDALILQTKLPNLPAFRKVKIGDSDTWAMIVVEGRGADDGKAVAPGFFMINRMTFSAKQTETLMVQQNTAASLYISLQDQTPAGTRVITLQEQFPMPMANNPGSCQLTIMDLVAGRPRAPVILNSKNFEALTLEHPVEMDHYLRPVLEQIDQQQALVPDQMLAFELFSDQWTPAAAAAAKVHSLVANLSGGDFRSRTRAERELAALGDDAALVLIHLDRTELDAEQNARIDKILAPYRPVPAAEAAKLGSAPTEFLANCLYSDDGVIRKAAFARLLAVTKLPLKFDPAAPAAQRSAELAPLLEQVAATKP